ncbi:hypothetical protein HDV01_005070 [Terramyces sp. JEL0728]|nr:hypothetical protein HDV01_005070 [Terramyces sp. JEL0728]
MQPVAWLVSVVFWTLLAPGLFSDPNSTTFALVTGPISHVFNLLFPLIELFLCTYELRKSHLLFAFLVVVLYPTFIVILHQFDNTHWPYSFLVSLNGGEVGIKWGPMLGFLVFVFVCIIVFFFITLFLIKIRERIAKRRQEERMDDLELKRVSTNAQRRTPKYKPLRRKESQRQEETKDNPLESAFNESDIPELPPIIQLKSKSSDFERQVIYKPANEISAESVENTGEQVSERESLPVIDPYTEKLSKELQSKLEKLEIDATCDFIVNSSNSTVVQAYRKMKSNNVAPAAELFQDEDIEPWNVSNSPVESVRYLSTIDRMDSDEELFIYNENGEKSVISME